MLDGFGSVGLGLVGEGGVASPSLQVPRHHHHIW